MLSGIYIYPECRKQAHYAKFRYPECRYAECRGAMNTDGHGQVRQSAPPIRSSVENFCLRRIFPRAILVSQLYNSFNLALMLDLNKLDRLSLMSFFSILSNICKSGQKDADAVKNSNSICSGPCFSKLFRTVIYKCSIYARMFVPGRPLQPSLMIVGKARILP